MTCVAYRSGVLAADTQVTDWGQKWRAKKIWRIDSDAGELLVGICGELYPAMAFVEWLKNSKNRKPDIGNEDFEAIVIARTGRVTLWNQSLAPVKPRGKFFAVGSGGAAALGAMHAGKGAIEAVQIAKLIDPYTGGTVVSLKLRRA